MALAWTLDKIGPMCRSAEDCGLVLHQIAGSDADDPGSAHKSFTYAPQFDRQVSDFTVGYSPSDFDHVAPEARAAFSTALEAVKKLGVKLKEVPLPDFPYGGLVETIIGAEAASIFEDVIRSGKVDQLADSTQAATLKAAVDIPAVDYLKAMRIRGLIREAFRETIYRTSICCWLRRGKPRPRLSRAARRRRYDPSLAAWAISFRPAI